MMSGFVVFFDNIAALRIVLIYVCCIFLKQSIYSKRYVCVHVHMVRVSAWPCLSERPM